MLVFKIPSWRLRKINKQNMRNRSVFHYFYDKNQTEKQLGRTLKRVFQEKSCLSLKSLDALKIWCKKFDEIFEAHFRNKLI